MNNVYNNALQDRLESYLKNAGISQAKAAALIGVSQSVLSQYRRSVYEKGNIEEVENKINEFFRLQDEQKTMELKALPFCPVSKDEYIPTSISEYAYKLIRYCQLEKGIVIIHGDAGVGKTKGAEKFVLENPTSSIYIETTPSSGTLKGLLKSLARVLKIPENQSNLELGQAVRDKLEGTNKVIIIDEAQNLKFSALEEIRTMAEPNRMCGRKGVGIVLIGNSEVYDRMIGRQEARFAQQFNRTRMNTRFRTSDITRDDVIKVFPVLVKREMKKEIDFLTKVCQSRWGIRSAVNIYNDAVNQQDISSDTLLAIAQGMGIRLLG